VSVADVESSGGRPVRELKGSAKVFLESDASQSVSIVLDQRAFSFWSTKLRRWVVEAGDFEIGVGPSLRHLPLSETVSIEAPRLAEPLSRDSTLKEWMADPGGRRASKTEEAGGR